MSESIAAPVAETVPTTYNIAAQAVTPAILAEIEKLSNDVGPIKNYVAPVPPATDAVALLREALTNGQATIRRYANRFADGSPESLVLNQVAGWMFDPTFIAPVAALDAANGGA